jgi:MFS family permease
LAKVFEAPYQPAVAAETPHLVSERELAVANSLIGTISNAAVVAGPLLGALSVLLGSVEVAFVVNAATFFVAAGLVSVTRGMSRGRLDVERRPLAVLAETWDGLRAVVSSPAARAILAIVAGASFIYGADTVLLVLTSTRQLGSGSHAYGYFIGALGVGGLVAVPVVDWFAGMRRVGTALYVGTLLVAVPIVLLRWTHALPPALLLVGVSGAALMLVEVTTITALQRAVPEQLLARVFGAYDSCYVFGMIVGALLSDPLVHAIGLGWTFVVFGLGQPAVMLAAVPGLVAVNRASAARLAALRDRIALFAGLDLFAGAPRAVAEELAGAAVEFDVPTGTEVVREGEPAHDFFVVRSGRLDVVSAGESGEPRWVNELSAGSYFGEIGLLLGRPRTATVRASADSELYRLSAEEFLAAVNGSAAAGRVAVEGVGQRLARTHPRLASSAPFTMPAGEGLAV